MTFESFKIEHLSNILKEFCTENKLPYLSADDLLTITIIKTEPYQICGYYVIVSYG